MRSKALYYFLPTLASGLTPIAVLPLLTRAIRVDEFGLFALAQAIAVIINAVLALGVQIAFERNFFEPGRDADGKGVLAFAGFSFLFGIAVIGALFAALGSALFAPLWSDATHSSSQLRELLTVMALAVGLRGANQLLYANLRFAERAPLYAGLSFFEAAFGPALVLVAVLVLKLGASGMAWAQLTTQILLLPALAASGLPIFRSQWWQRCRQEWVPQLRHILAVGSPLCLRQILNAVGGQLDKIILGSIATTGAVGAYALAERVSGLYFLMMTALGQVFIPEVYQRMFKHESERTQDPGVLGTDTVGRYLTPFLFLSVGIALTAVVFSTQAFVLLAPADYAGAETIAALLILSTSLLFFSKVHSAQLMFAKRAATHSRFAVFQLALSLAISWPLTALFGALGAASATIVTRGLYVTAMGRAAQHCYRILWSWRSLLAMYGVLAGAVAMVLFGLSDLAPFDWRNLGLRAAALLVYVGVCWRMVVAPASSRGSLQLRWRRSIG